MKSSKTFTARDHPMTCRARGLKTAEIADALGVSVSSVKRWVDQGRITADRTAGNHRLITLEEVDRFARSCGLTLRRGFGEPEEQSAAVPTDHEALPERLTACLKAGDGPGAARLIRGFHSASGAVALADRVLGPVMENIGHGWEIGDWDVYEEHQASCIVARILSEILSALDASRSLDGPARLAIGATPEGDLYTLSLSLGEIVLREAGWKVRNLGSNLPHASLIEAMRTYRPVLVFYAVSHLADPAGFVRAFQDLSRAAEQLDVHVMVGGRALCPAIREKLRGARIRFGERMRCLSELGRALVTDPSVS